MPTPRFFRSLSFVPVLTVASIAALIASCSGTDGSTDGGGGEGGDAATLAGLPAPELPGTPLSYASDLPASYRTGQVTDDDTTPADNPTTDAGATLGRVLFYDKRMSKNGKVACASCHDQSHGFGDTREKSVGFKGESTARHAMPVVDTRFYQRGKFFWDERAASLEDQTLMPIQSDVEMGMTLDELVSRLGKTSYYPALFEAAFGDSEVTRDRVARALAQFLRSIVSYRSKWDTAVAATSSIAGDLPGYSAEENRGKEIFFGQYDTSTRGLCGTCHLMGNELGFLPPNKPAPVGTNTAVFYMVAPTNNGIIDDADKGVGAITGLSTDEGKFKAPSLRNVALRAPYMHDGRFATLEEVVDHYSTGIEAATNLDPALRQGGPNGGPLKLNLSDADKAALIAFLETLSDDTIASDVRFSDPFPKE